MSSFSPLSFTLVYRTLHTYGLPLISQTLCYCCLVTTWRCVLLADLLNDFLRAGRNGVPPTPSTSWDAVTTCTPCRHCFLSTWGAVRLEKKRKGFYSLAVPITLTVTLSKALTLTLTLNLNLTPNPKPLTLNHLANKPQQTTSTLFLV